MPLDGFGNRDKYAAKNVYMDHSVLPNQMFMWWFPGKRKCKELDRRHFWVPQFGHFYIQTWPWEHNTTAVVNLDIRGVGGVYVVQAEMEPDVVIWTDIKKLDFILRSCLVRV